ncbi:DUF3160 domain-containing protein, partial [Candidatus Bipolaricaulota bacterium]|nr:DUF3160 domain-containing protein [Candidatus Bipolaricaulota bacterium]
MSSKMAIISLVLVLGVTLAFFAFSGGNWFSGDQHSTLSLEKATNLNRFDFSTKQKQKLNDQGFLLSSTDQKNIYDIYLGNGLNGTPSFITTDLILHTAHLLYNYSLKAAEYRSLQPKLEELTNQMVKLSSEQYSQLEEGKLKRASRVNLAFFSVGKKLIYPSWKAPDAVREIVNEEIRLINRNTETGIRVSPLMEYKVNYASFLPRGDYTKNEKLKSYFKLVTWFGQIYYRLKPGRSTAAVAKGRQETLSALLMIKLFHSQKSAQKLWDQVNALLTDFAGPADNLQVTKYIGLATTVFGDDLGIRELQSEVKLDKFIEEALKGSPPRALPVWAASRGVPRDLAQGFCLLSRRYDLSTDIFQNLVFPNVGSRDNPRTIPKGLDVMAALGSDGAEKILREQGDFNYESYENQLADLKGRFAGATVQGSSYGKGLKSQWIATLKKLITEHPADKRSPFGSTWKLKQLNAALGSWTELKHDTVLYSKVSTAMARGVTPMTKGYVEPRPDIYDSVAEFTLHMKERANPPAELQDKLERFRQLVKKLQNISKRELED